MLETIPRALLPPVLADVSDLIGLDLTMRLIDDFGGWRVYIPKEPTEECELARCIGVEPARKLARVFEMQFLWVPACYAAQRVRRDDLIVARYLAGEKPRALAREYKISVRHIFKILSKR